MKTIGINRLNILMQPFAKSELSYANDVKLT